jgi:hypothetical protein
MHPLSVLLFSILFLTVAHAQDAPVATRLCVSVLKNTTRLHTVNPKWQQTQLVKAFERINKD